ncbi:hypothetical protein N7474_003781 [Penicillium riverlandense]|uniref:uncharacterized protein n=1 Tax=Penicillium riverlandense TaxID=1903569 RepID=UPI0025496B1C|nr:uncharacterized protein N7474_003781 [Penicillium riverlandense]KAJ5818190.1 hypothetical protein N7474_003781 [Penicillium riverlandense]
MAAVDCMSMAPSMASCHHPHHPFNNPNRRLSYSSYSSFGSNNPYARYMSPSPSRHRRIRSDSVPSSLYSGTPEDHRDCSIPRRRASARQPRYSRHSQLVQPDIIDELDNVSLYSYHHEGPYDAVRPERNWDIASSPLEAVKESNAEALKATPHHKIVDSINSHRPLDGTAFYPPGTTDRNGQTYEYEEGANMMNDLSNFFRIPGLRFTDKDFEKDPFYTRPLSNPFTQLRKKLSLRRKRRSNTA